MEAEELWTEKYRPRKLADIVGAAAENGADNAFGDILHSFLKELPLPPLRPYARYPEPPALSEDLKRQLQQCVIDEYSQDNIYVYAYGAGYKQTFPTFEDYIARVAELVVTGAMNGAGDTLEATYRALARNAPLPPVRRHPRRLKMW